MPVCSPLKSPTATATGTGPVVNSVFAPNVPEPAEAVIRNAPTRNATAMVWFVVTLVNV